LTGKTIRSEGTMKTEWKITCAYLIELNTNKILSSFSKITNSLAKGNAVDLC